MSRAIQPGDLVSDQNGTLYRIEEILEDRIKVYLLTNPSDKNIILFTDGEWKLEGEEPVVFINQDELKQPFTHLHEMDIIILSYLDDTVLKAVCQVNKYAQSLCQDENLWKLRLERFYPKYANGEGREPGETWYSFYHTLRNLLGKNGELDIYKLVMFKRYRFLEKNPDKVTLEVINFTATNGLANVLDWFLQRGKPLPDIRGVNGAAINGQVEVLELIRQRGGPVPNDVQIANIAAMMGHVDLLHWLKQNNIMVPDALGLAQAASNGCLNVLKWARQEGLPLPDNLPDEAAAGGKIEVLDWLKEIKGVPSKAGVLKAISEGKIETLEWLKDNNLLVVDREMIDEAVRRDKVVILDWFYKNTSPKIAPSQGALNVAALAGFLDPLIWVADHYPGLYPSEEGRNWAAMNGKLNVVQWLFRETGKLPTQYGINMAARNGRLDVIKWVVGKNPDLLPDERGIEWAVENNRLDLLRWMKEYIQERKRSIRAEMAT